MAKKNSSVFEDLFGIAALLPWWAGVFLACLSWAILHHYAGTPIDPNGAKLVGSMLVRAFAQPLQYIVPLILLAGAGASALGRRKRARLLRDVASDASGAALRSLSWRDFEQLVGEAFRMRGFTVTETGGGGADGGVDLKLVKHNEVFLVQCKQWRAYKVSVTVVRELFGVMAAEGATGGFVVTSGVFTAEARAFAEGRNVELIDGPALEAMIARARVAQDARVPRPGSHAGATGSAAAAQAPIKGAPASAPAPMCPRCGSAMLQRVAARGENAGRTFWGCTQFPKCRGIA
jgi:restriction system protein